MPFCVSRLKCWAFETSVRSALVRGSSARAHRLVILGLAVPAAARFLPTTVDRVYSSPGAPLGLILGSATFLVAFLNMLGLPFFFFCVFRFVPAWHRFLLVDHYHRVQIVYRQATNSADKWQMSASGGIFFSA